MKHAYKLVVLTALSIFMCSCSTFTYNQKTYSSAEEALLAQKEHLISIENQINRGYKKFDGKAIVVVPSKKTCEALGVVKTGSPSSEFTEFIASSLLADYSKFPDYIRKRNLFDSVELAVDDFTKPYADKVKNSYMAVIYFQLLSPNQAGWFVMNKPDYTPKAINFSSTAGPGYPKVQSWLDDLEEKISGGSHVK